MKVGAVESKFPLVDGRGRERVLKLEDDVGWTVRNHIVRSQRIARNIYERIVDVVTSIHCSPVRKDVIEPGHPGVFSHRVVGDPGDLVGYVVHWGATLRVCVE